MTAAGPIHGHCLCGAVRITVAGEHDPRPGACHCRMCQRWSGGLFLCFHAEEGAVTVEGAVATYRSSPFAERAFCPVCGSHLWIRTIDPAGSGLDLMPGLFDAVLGAPLRSEVYSDQAMASVTLAGDHPRATREVYERKNPHVRGDAP
jgi:hypothetical protein